MRIGITLAAAVFAFACQPGPVDQSKNTPSQSTTMPANETAAVQTSALDPIIPPEKDHPSSSPTPAGPTQEVHLIEYQIHSPQTLPAGRMTLRVENGGKEDHALAIEGNGVKQQTIVLKRGDTTSMQVDLQPGSYTLYDPVAGNRQKGMQTTVTVQ